MAKTISIVKEVHATNRKLAVRWGGYEEFFDPKAGWVGVPDVFLRHYSNLRNGVGLTTGEAMFVLELMTYKWSAQEPYPSYGTLAKRMGVSDKMVRRYAAQLEGKGFLKRESRTGTTNTFDLRPLFDALKQKLGTLSPAPAALAS